MRWPLYRRLACCGILLLGALLPLAALAQGTAYLSIGRIDSREFPQVTFFLRAANANGQPLRGLETQPERLRISEEDQTVSNFTIRAVDRSEPLHIVLVLDASGSMSGERMESAKAAAHSFADTLTSEDRVAVVAFGNTVYPTQPAFLPPGEELEKQIDSITPNARGTGKTVLYEALLTALDLASRGPVGQTLIVLLSDGESDGENAAVYNFELVRDKAGETPVPIHTVGIDRGRERDLPFLDTLKSLSQITGGLHYRIPEAQLISQLEGNFADIAAVLQKQYQLTFTSKLERDGKMHPLHVELSVEGTAPVSATRYFIVSNAEPPSLPAPEPYFVDLHDGAQVRGAITATVAEKQGLPLSRVEFLLGDTPAGRDDSPPFTFQWNSCDSERGVYTLTAQATAENGKTGQVHVRLQFVEPVAIQILKPQVDEVFAGSVPVQVTMEGVPIARTEYLVDMVPVTPTRGADSALELDLRHLVNGAHVLTVKAYGPGSCSGEAQVPFQIERRIPTSVILLLALLGVAILATIVAVVVSRSRQSTQPLSPAMPVGGTVGGGVNVGGEPWGQVGPPPVRPEPSPTETALPPVRRDPTSEAAGPSVRTEAALPVVGRAAIADTVAEGLPVVSPTKWWLIVKQGPQAGQQFPLAAGQNILGRSRQHGATIVLTDPKVSRKHASIVKEGDHFVLSDIGSRGGTLLKGLPLTGSQPLQDGNEIKIGDTVLVFRQL